MPAQTLPEFIAYAKANPGKLSYSSAGVGTASHMGMELLKATTGIDMVHVPTRGTGPAMVDLLGGQVQAMLGSLPVMLPEQRNGRIRLIATAERKRSAWTPDLPTVEEAGFPGFESGNWTGLLGPANLDPAIIATLNKHIVEILNTPEIKERLFAVGFEPIGSTPAEFSATIRRDIERWTETGKKAGVRAPYETKGPRSFAGTSKTTNDGLRERNVRRRRALPSRAGRRRPARGGCARSRRARS